MVTKIKYSVLFCIILFSSCGIFCDREGKTFRLDEIERSLVPYDVEQELVYSDGSLDYFASVEDIVLAKEEIDRNTPCNVNSLENLSYNIKINSLDYIFRFRISSNSGAIPMSSVKYDSQTDQSIITYNDISASFVSFQDDNVTLENVLVVNDFTPANQNETPVTNLIAYSRERGVEYILFTNGDYLILQP